MSVGIVYDYECMQEIDMMDELQFQHLLKGKTVMAQKFLLAIRAGNYEGYTRLQAYQANLSATINQLMEVGIIENVIFRRSE